MKIKQQKSSIDYGFKAIKAESGYRVPELSELVGGVKFEVRHNIGTEKHPDYAWFPRTVVFDDEIRQLGVLMADETEPKKTVIVSWYDTMVASNRIRIVCSPASKPKPSKDEDEDEEEVSSIVENAELAEL